MATATPKPTIDVWNKPFWSACREGRLLLQRDGDSGKCWYPPSHRSPYAPRAAWDWVECSGKGKVLSRGASHQKYFDGFADELPYVVAMVQLAEGAMLLTNIVSKRDTLAVGVPVEEAFQERGDCTVPVFKLGVSAS